MPVNSQSVFLVFYVWYWKGEQKCKRIRQIHWFTSNTYTNYMSGQPQIKCLWLGGCLWARKVFPPNACWRGLSLSIMGCKALMMQWTRLSWKLYVTKSGILLFPLNHFVLGYLWYHSGLVDLIPYYILTIELWSHQAVSTKFSAFLP